MKIKCKSPLFHSIIEKVDEQLDKVPVNDAQGSPLEDSMDFDMYVDAIKNLRLINAKGTVVHPFSTSIATQLIYDELEEKRVQSNGDKWRE